MRNKRKVHEEKKNREKQTAWNDKIHPHFIEVAGANDEAHEATKKTKL